LTGRPKVRFRGHTGKHLLVLSLTAFALRKAFPHARRICSCTRYQSPLYRNRFCVIALKDPSRLIILAVNGAVTSELGSAPFGSEDIMKASIAGRVRSGSTSMAAKRTQKKVDAVHVAVKVDGRSWSRVLTLAASGPNDRHFLLVTKPNGSTAVRFGDGIHGASASKALKVDVTFGKGADAIRLSLRRNTPPTDDQGLWAAIRNHARRGGRGATGRGGRTLHTHAICFSR